MATVMCQAGWTYELCEGGVKIGGRDLTYSRVTPALPVSECKGLVNIPAEFNGLPLVKLDGFSFVLGGSIQDFEGLIIPETVKEVSSTFLVMGMGSEITMFEYHGSYSLYYYSEARQVPSRISSPIMRKDIYFKGDVPLYVYPFVTRCYNENQGEDMDCAFIVEHGQFYLSDVWAVEGTSWKENAQDQ